MNHTDGFEIITHQGRPHWFHAPTGKVLPLVRGGDGPNDPPPTDPPAGDPADPPAGSDEAKFTQADLDKHIATARSQAKRAAAKELEDQLGISASEARAVIAAKNKADQDAMSEADRIKAEAKAAKDEADADRKAARAERFNARLERKLTAAGIPEAALTRAVRLVDLDHEADDEAITAEIETLKGEVPGLFEQPATGTPAPRAPSGVTNGARPPAGGQTAKTSLDKGAELYAATRPKTPAA